MSGRVRGDAAWSTEEVKMVRPEHKVVIEYCVP